MSRSKLTSMTVSSATSVAPAAGRVKYTLGGTLLTHSPSAVNLNSCARCMRLPARSRAGVFTWTSTWHPVSHLMSGENVITLPFHEYARLRPGATLVAFSVTGRSIGSEKVIETGEARGTPVTPSLG